MERLAEASSRTCRLAHVGDDNDGEIKKIINERERQAIIAGNTYKYHKPRKKSKRGK